jgi:hypothetical protein
VEQAHSAQVELVNTLLDGAGRTFHWTLLLERSLFPLSYSAPGYLCRSKLATKVSICIVGFCIHGNTCFTYHLISNNGKLNIWCEGISGF